MTRPLHDERLYILTKRLTQLRIVAGILMQTTGTGDRDKAAINTAQTKIQGVILRNERELEEILKETHDYGQSTSAHKRAARGIGN